MKHVRIENRILLSVIMLSISLPLSFLQRTSAQSSIQSCFYKEFGDADCNGSIDLVDFERFRTEFLTFKKGDLDIKDSTTNFVTDASLDLLDFEAFRKGLIESRNGTLPTPTVVPSATVTGLPTKTQTPSLTNTPTPTVTITATPAPTQVPTTLEGILKESMVYSASRLNATLSSVSTSSYPQSANPNWAITTSSSWSSGFLAGNLWEMYQYTNDPIWKQKAEQRTAPLESRKNDKTTHDVGFIIFNSFGNALKQNSNPEYKSIALTAANSLASRYSPIVGCTKSWDSTANEFQVIIDNMMNLELLFWAAKNGGDPKLYDMAVSHATKTMENHIRADGSTYQLVIYDPATGAVKGRGNTQGLNVNSVWARGLSWSIYGFTVAYRETNDVKFLQTAEKSAEYYLNNVPADKVPYWDFKAPITASTPRDSSAAAVTASGLLELSKLEADTTKKTRYKKAAEDILTSLSSNSYLSKGTPNKAVLLHGTYNYNRGNYNTGLIWGDYYYLEAINKYFGKY